MAYQMAATAVTLKVIHRVAGVFKCNPSNILQHFTRFQLTVCSHGSSALAELLIDDVNKHFGVLLSIHNANNCCSLNVWQIYSGQHTPNFIKMGQVSLKI